jgi:ABC-2 type transport system permease protein
VEETLDLVRLTPIAEQRFLTYSTGMRQRLCIARALLHKPNLLFLDEPTKGLDPTAAGELHKLIRSELVEKGGITALMSTHNLDEAELMCDRIAIMHTGVLRACGTIHELRASLDLRKRFLLSVSELPDDSRPALARRIPGIEFLPEEAETEVRRPAPALEKRTLLRVSHENGHASLDDALDALRQLGAKIQSANQEEIPLENVFAHYTQPAQTANPGSLPIVPQPEPPASQPSLPEGRPNVHKIGLSLPLALAFLKRDWLSEVSYPVAFTLQLFSILLSVGVFYFISEMLGDSVAPILSQYGGDYFSFVLIGIAFTSYFGVGLSSFASSLRQAQTTGTLEAMLTTPTTISALIIASSLWDYLLTTVRVLVYLGVGGLLLGVDLGRGNYAAAGLTLVLTVIVFSGVGIIAASFIMVLKRGDPITWAFSALSSFLGGVYYPLEVLPGWLQFLARLLPITYSLEAMRMALLNGASFAQILPHLSILTLFGIVLLPISLLAFRFAVRRARQDGSLTHY